MTFRDHYVIFVTFPECSGYPHLETLIIQRNSLDSTTNLLMLHLPLSLEDRTGVNTASDFDDIYDRVFLHVATHPGTSTVNIYKMSQRGSRRRDTLPFNPTTPAAATLSFGPRDSLGTVSFGSVLAEGGGGGGAAMAMGQYLKRTSLFGGSLSRKFIGSDGREYKWNYRSVVGQEWTVCCLRSIGL